jgi:ferredoxin
MKVKVDLQKCRDHGQCVISAPQVFQFDADRKLVWVGEPDAALRPAVEEAADACPEQAIRIDDD